MNCDQLARVDVPTLSPLTNSNEGFQGTSKEGPFTWEPLLKIKPRNIKNFNNFI
jgi:hypothetical protein